MLGKTSVALVLAAFLASGFTAPSNAAVTMPMALGQSMGNEIDRVSFWGEPYPYGYAYLHNPCIRYFRIETARGWRWKREWVCQ